jgi:hypothetical protein
MPSPYPRATLKPSQFTLRRGVSFHHHAQSGEIPGYLGRSGEVLPESPDFWGIGINLECRDQFGANPAFLPHNHRGMRSPARSAQTLREAFRIRPHGQESQDGLTRGPVGSQLRMQERR